MALPDTLSLTVGIGPGLRRGHDLLCMAAAAALLNSGASWRDVALALVVLVVACMVSRWRMRLSNVSGILQLRRDGSATLLESGRAIELQWLGRGWRSNRICVLPLAELGTGAQRHVVLCRALNSADSFRRLLIAMQTHPSDRMRRLTG